MRKVFQLLVGFTLLSAALATAQSPCGASTPGSPHVCLTWTAPVPVSGVTVASYNIYRATVTKGENYATPLNTSPITTLFFADTTDAVGTTYYYTVTAVSTGGVQSTPSSEASALVPVPPGQPQSPGATSY